MTSAADCFPFLQRDNYLWTIMLLMMLFEFSSCRLWPLQDVVGGRFDAGQAFVGELSQVNIWDRVLKPVEVQSIANCSLYIPGNVISWLASSVEVFGRGAFKRPLEMCQERLPNAWNSSICLCLDCIHSAFFFSIVDSRTLWTFCSALMWTFCFIRCTQRDIWDVFEIKRLLPLQNVDCRPFSQLPYWQNTGLQIAFMKSDDD